MATAQPGAGLPAAAAAYLLKPSPSFVCPISRQLMCDPVIAADGHSYERVEIQRWLLSNTTTPNNEADLVHQALVRNHELRNVIREWLVMSVKAGAQWAVGELEKMRAPLPEFEDQAKKLVDEFERKNQGLSERLVRLSEELRMEKERTEGRMALSKRLDERRQDQMEQQQEELQVAREEVAIAKEAAAMAKEAMESAEQKSFAAVAEAVASKAEAAAAKDESALAADAALVANCVLTEKLHAMDSELACMSAASPPLPTAPHAHSKATCTEAETSPRPSIPASMLLQLGLASLSAVVLAAAVLARRAASK